MGARPYTTAVPPEQPASPSGRHRLMRPPFRPQPVRSPQDALPAAAHYLQWLGFEDLELTDGQDREAVTLLGSRMVAQVDTWPDPADVKAVECLWMQTLHSEEMASAMFTLARLLAPGGGPRRTVAGRAVHAGRVGHPAAGERRGRGADGDRLDVLTPAAAEGATPQSVPLVIWCTSSPPC
ncbi:hypothetical protein ACFQ1I_12675 [Kitasatospora arboriphila]